MTPERVQELVAAVRAWPKPERLRWRALLDSHPDEALLLAEFALELDASPVPEALSANAPPRSFGRRELPPEAEAFRARLRGDQPTPTQEASSA